MFGQANTTFLLIETGNSHFFAFLLRKEIQTCLRHQKKLSKNLASY
jgi:hypothetical protein